MDLADVLAVHVPSPNWPRQCICGGRAGACLAIRRAREAAGDDEKSPGSELPQGETEPGL